MEAYLNHDVMSHDGHLLLFYCSILYVTSQQGEARCCEDTLLTQWFGRYTYMLNLLTFAYDVLIWFLTSSFSTSIDNDHLSSSFNSRSSVNLFFLLSYLPLHPQVTNIVLFSTKSLAVNDVTFISFSICMFAICLRLLPVNIFAYV